MADYKKTIEFGVEDNASSIIQQLNERIAELEKQLAELKAQQDANSEFVVSPEVAAAVVNNIYSINEGLIGLNQKMTETANSTQSVDAGFAQNIYYASNVASSYASIQAQLTLAGAALAALAGAFVKYPKQMASAIYETSKFVFDLKLKLLSIPFQAGGALSKFFIETLPNTLTATNNAFAKASLKVSQFAADFLQLSKLSGIASFANQALIVEEFARASYNAAEAVKNTTLALGDLSKEFTDFDSKSIAVLRAKERYEELEAASFKLGKSTDELFSSYKTLFDTLKQTSVSAKDGASTFEDVQKVQEKLRATTDEVAKSNAELNAAYAAGTTNIKQLASIFGASLFPALDSVAKQMGLTRDQLVELINSGKIGSENVLPALAAAARENTKDLDTLTKSTNYTHTELQKLVEQGKIAATDVLPGMSTALGQAGEQMSKTDKAIQNMSNAWKKFLSTVGEPFTADTGFIKSISDSWNNFWQETNNKWDQFKADSINSIGEIGLGLSVLANDVKQGFNVVGESIGTTFAAITNWNFSDLGDALDGILQNAANKINSFTGKANELNSSLWGTEDAAKKDKEAMEGLKEAIDKVPAAKLSEDFEEAAKKITATTEASEAVNIVWKALKDADPFSGKDKSTLTLSLAIQDVAKKTGDAAGTTEAFAKKLSELPAEQLLKVLDSAQKLPNELKKISDTGEVVQTVTTAAFQKLGIEASSFGDSVSKAGKESLYSFAIVASSANTTSGQIRAAFQQAIDSAKTEADIKALSEYFTQFAATGRLSAEQIALEMTKLSEKQTEIANANSPVSESFKRLGVESSRQFETIAASAKTAFGIVESGSGVVQNVEKSFLAWAEAEIKAAEAAGRVIDPLVAQKAAALGLKDKYDEMVASLQKVSPAMDGIVDATKRIEEQFDKQEARAEGEADYYQKSADLAIQLAKAKGQEVEARRLAAKEAEDELKRSKERIEQTRLEIQSLQKKKQETIDAAFADGEINAEEAKLITSLDDKITKLAQENALRVQGIPLLQHTADETKTLANNTNTYLSVLTRFNTAEQNSLDIQGQLLDLKLSRVRQEKQLAEAMGDSELATRKQKEADEAAIEVGTNAVAQAQSKLEGMSLEYQQTLSNALADGVLTQAEQDLIASKEQAIAQQRVNVQAAQQDLEMTEKQIDAQKKHAKANEETTHSYTVMASAGAKSVGQLQELSAGTRNMVSAQAGLFTAMTKGAEETSEKLEKLKTHLAGTESALYRNAHNAVMLRGEFMRAIDAANNTWKAYDEQAIAAEQSVLHLTKAAESNNMSIREMREIIGSTTNEIDLLDKQSLDNLNSAIEAANNKLREMEQQAFDARQAIADLNEEILREKGQNDEADRLALEIEQTEKLADIDNKLQEAKLQQNRELIDLYEEQKRKLQELYDLKDSNLEKEIKQRKEETKTETTSSNNTTTSKSGNSGITTTAADTISKIDKATVVQFLGAKGESIKGMFDEKDVSRMLDLLQKSGFTLAR